MNSPITTYQQACAYLDAMQMHKIKLGLDAMKMILADLGSPEKSCPAVHVAGTNGKGSVCTMLHSIMSHAGYRTGIYTSPHLSSVRERFRIDDAYIPENDFTRLMELIRVTLDGRSITYFECATALAFSWFAEQQCDLIIVETGLGGRLDATNVLNPLVSIITTISLDHEQYLGNTVEAVASEKAGIVKEGIPVISGVVDAGPRRVIEDTCRQKQALLLTRTSAFNLEDEGDGFWRWYDRSSVTIENLILPAGGEWQAENSAIAIAAAVLLGTSGFKVDIQTIREGLKCAHWPGRMERLDIIPSFSVQGVENSKQAQLRFLLDGAHNEAGVRSLLESLKHSFEFTRLFVLWASMGDKTYEEMLNSVARKADYLVLTQPDPERSATPEKLVEALDSTACKTPHECVAQVNNGLMKICEMATPDDLVLVAGSLYLIGAVRKLLVGEVVS